MGVGAGGSDGPLHLVGEGRDCTLALPNDPACATVNEADTPAPWSYTPKFGLLGTFPFGSFFEGGINVTRLLGTSRCFSYLSSCANRFSRKSTTSAGSLTGHERSAVPVDSRADYARSPVARLEVPVDVGGLSARLDAQSLPCSSSRRCCTRMNPTRIRVLDVGRRTPTHVRRSRWRVAATSPTCEIAEPERRRGVVGPATCGRLLLRSSTPVSSGASSVPPHPSRREPPAPPAAWPPQAVARGTPRLRERRRRTAPPGRATGWPASRRRAPPR